MISRGVGICIPYIDSGNKIADIILMRPLGE